MVLLRSFVVIFLCNMILSMSANAVTVSRIDVGFDDTYLHLCSSALGPNDEDEATCFSNALIPTHKDQIVKDESPTFIELADEPLVYALALPTNMQSSHFLIKTGNIGGADKQYSFILTNNDKKEYAVFNLAYFQNLINPPCVDGEECTPALIPNADFDGIGKISHVSAFTTLATPLPAAVWMMITALGGMFGFRKIGLRRRKAA